MSLNNKLYKIVFVGEMGVGKTSLLVRYADNTFSEHAIGNDGVDSKIKSINVGGTEMALQIWDTAGQERFRTVTANYYREADAAILVYDICNRQSFEEIKNWMREVEKYCPAHVQKILVGNKIDKVNREVCFEEGEDYANCENINFCEVSAATGNGVDGIFLTLGKKIKQKIPNKRRTRENINQRAEEKHFSCVNCN